MGDVVHGRDAAAVAAPKNVILILLDSLNRHMLGAYGGRGRVRDAATSTGSRRGRCGSRSTTTGSLPCMPARHDMLCGALDFLWKPWGSDRDLGAVDHGVSARAGRDDDADLGPSAPVRDGRRELSHRLQRLGVRARARERPVEDASRPELGRRAADGAAVHAVRQLARLLPRGARLPRPAHDGGGGALARRQRRLPRPLLAVRRRVRPARAVRYAGAVRIAVRRLVGRAAPDLAAVRRAARSRRACSTSGRRARCAPATAAS